MGMTAILMAIGPHNKTLLKYYDYPLSWYDSVPENAMLVCQPIQCETTSASLDLAFELEIETDDFESHRILPIKMLRLLNGEFQDWLNKSFGREAGLRAYEALSAFANAGWEFYYLPEA